MCIGYMQNHICSIAKQGEIMIIMKQIICIYAVNLRKRMKKQPRHVRGICPHRLTPVFVRYVDDPLLEWAIVPWIFVSYSCIVNVLVLCCCNSISEHKSPRATFVIFFSNKSRLSSFPESAWIHLVVKDHSPISPVMEVNFEGKGKEKYWGVRSRCK